MSQNFILANIHLFTSGNFSYYKVPVSDGTKMLEGSVETACKSVGLLPVCPGSSTCSYTTERCFETPLSRSIDGCSYFTSISEQICGYTDPKQCKAIDNLFMYMNDWFGGVLGVVGQSYLAYGTSYVSGEGGEVYYAYCVMCGDCTGDSHGAYNIYRNTCIYNVAWSSWSTCGTNCKRIRTRSCTGGSECEQSETDDKKCQDGNCDSSEYMTFLQVTKVLAKGYFCINHN